MSSLQPQAALFAALTAHNLEGVSQALEVGADPDLPLATGAPPLIWAAQSDARAALRRLLRGGANPDVRDRQGETALSWASWHGHTALVKDLLAFGAGRESHGRQLQAPPLLLATARGHRGIVALLATTADVNTRGGPGATPALLMLLDAFPAAVRPLERVRQIAHILIDAGADPALTDRHGRSAINRAEQLGDDYLIRLFQR